MSNEAALGQLSANLCGLRKSWYGLRDSLVKNTQNKSLGKFASAFGEHLVITDSIIDTIDKIIDGVESLRKYAQIEPELLATRQKCWMPTRLFTEKKETS